MLTVESFLNLLAFVENETEFKFLQLLSIEECSELDGSGIGSVDWFLFNNLKFWYSVNTEMYSDDVIVVINAYETTEPGSTIKKENGEDATFTSKPFKIEFMYKQFNLGYLISNYVLKHYTNEFGISKAKIKTIKKVYRNI